VTGWNQLPLSDGHANVLVKAAIAPDVAAEGGISTVEAVADLPAEFRGYGSDALPAMVFRWTSITGQVLVQLRPDNPIAGKDGTPVRYLFPSGAVPVLNVHPAMRERVLDPRVPLVVVEGTKQYLAAVSALETLESPAYAAVGVAGCWGWCSGGGPVPDLDHIPWADREVVLCFDADMATNRQVWQAAADLTEQLQLRGAASVRYIKVPGGRTSGLDDALGQLRDPAAGMARLLEQAAGRMPRRPAAHTPHRPCFHGRTLLVDTLATVLRERYPMALAGDLTVAVYAAGVYRLGPYVLSSVVAEELGDLFRPTHRATVEEYLAATLFGEGITLPERAGQPVVNVANGMLDLRTGELKPHSPAWLSSTQLRVGWDPAAQCPTYERWLTDLVGDQVDDLEETAATMLDPSATPPKAMFCYGPSRSGKSTFLRLMQAIAGAANTSAVTLHQLSEDRFASANIYGKILNAAADLPAEHVRDLSVFKMLTGEDPICANRKYGRQFTFTNRALFAFSANEIPTVSETSTAYLERIKPFAFPRSFAGHEDPSIEHTLRDELPGILARWVRAWQRMATRGGYAATAPEVRAEFEAGSDRVRRWVAEQCQIITEVPDLPAEGNCAGNSTSAAGNVAGSSVSHAGSSTPAAGSLNHPRAVSPGTELPAEYGATKSELYKAFGDWAASSGMSRMNRTTFLNRLTSINAVCEVRLLPHRARGLNIALRPDDDANPWSAATETGSSGSFHPPPTRRAATTADDLEQGSIVHGKGWADTARTAHPAQPATPPPAPASANGERPPPRLPPDRFKIYPRPGDPIFRPSRSVTDEGEGE
jgi:putative DNA primase/helicase